MIFFFLVFCFVKVEFSGDDRAPLCCTLLRCVAHAGDEFKSTRRLLMAVRLNVVCAFVWAGRWKNLTDSAMNARIHGLLLQCPLKRAARVLVILWCALLPETMPRHAIYCVAFVDECAVLCRWELGPLTVPSVCLLQSGRLLNTSAEFSVTHCPIFEWTGMHSAAIGLLEQFTWVHVPHNYRYLNAGGLDGVLTPIWTYCTWGELFLELQSAVRR